MDEKSPIPGSGLQDLNLGKYNSENFTDPAMLGKLLGYAGESDFGSGRLGNAYSSPEYFFFFATVQSRQSLIFSLHSWVFQIALSESWFLSTHYLSCHCIIIP